jgi:predicted RNA-binding Zn ribbon-like protein
VTGAAVDLLLVEQFLNTLDERSFTRHGEKLVKTDRLTTVEALSAWLETHDLGPAGQELHPSDLATARALRAALRDALTDGGEAARLLADFPLRLAPDPSGTLRITAASGVPGLDLLVEAVAQSVGGGAWRRMKLCASTDCRWAFYDASRSGTSRWCSMGSCGNRHKTRAYRSRQAE